MHPPGTTGRSAAFFEETIGEMLSLFGDKLTMRMCQDAVEQSLGAGSGARMTLTDAILTVDGRSLDEVQAHAFFDALYKRARAFIGEETARIIFHQVGVPSR